MISSIWLLIAVQSILFIVIFSLLLYFASMMISDFIGVPFVPTSNRVIKQIFSELKIKKNDVFYDLGCGDGRLVFYIAKNYNIKSIGIEINPLLHFFAKLKARLFKVNIVRFYRQNLFKVDFKQATIIYLFLFPEVVKKLKSRLIKECRPKTIIISHGFKVPGLRNKLINTIKKRPFPTYYYQL